MREEERLIELVEDLLLDGQPIPLDLWAALIELGIDVTALENSING